MGDLSSNTNGISEIGSNLEKAMKKLQSKENITSDYEMNEGNSQDSEYRQENYDTIQTNVNHFISDSLLKSSPNYHHQHSGVYLNPMVCRQSILPTRLDINIQSPMNVIRSSGSSFFSPRSPIIDTTTELSYRSHQSHNPSYAFPNHVFCTPNTSLIRPGLHISEANVHSPIVPSHFTFSPTLSIFSPTLESSAFSDVTSSTSHNSHHVNGDDRSTVLTSEAMEQCSSAAMEHCSSASGSPTRVDELQLDDKERMEESSGPTINIVSNSHLYDASPSKLIMYTGVESAFFPVTSVSAQNQETILK